jgi:hypothetical protein
LTHDSGQRRAPTRLFAKDELSVLDTAANIAAELVSEAFGPDFGDFRQWPVDIRPFGEIAPSEQRHDVLAQLFRYARQGSVPLGGSPDYWRVCLYDPVIMATVKRENLLLPPMLSYILTHELIHVSRFIRFKAIFGLDEEVRSEEEEIVHRQTAHVLGNVAMEGMGDVLSLFRDRHLKID